MPKMKVTEQLVKRFLKEVLPQCQEFAEDGRWLEDDEFDIQLSLAQVIAFLKIIEKVEEWGWQCQLLSLKLELEELIAKLNRLLPTSFIRLRLIPTPLRIPASRLEVLQLLAGRAPPVAEIFIPIPHKTEMGSCARSDLAVAAY